MPHGRLFERAEKGEEEEEIRGPVGARKITLGMEFRRNTSSRIPASLSCTRPFTKSVEKWLPTQQQHVEIWWNVMRDLSKPWRKRGISKWFNSYGKENAHRDGKFIFRKPIELTLEKTFFLLSLIIYIYIYPFLMATLHMLMPVNKPPSRVTRVFVALFE